MAARPRIHQPDAQARGVEAISGPLAYTVDPRSELYARLWTAGVVAFVAAVTAGFFAIRGSQARESMVPKVETTVQRNF